MALPDYAMKNYNAVGLSVADLDGFIKQAIAGNEELPPWAPTEKVSRIRKIVYLERVAAHCRDRNAGKAGDPKPAKEKRAKPSTPKPDGWREFTDQYLPSNSKRPLKVKSVAPAEGGCTAAEFNAWLATLPPTPLAGEE